MTQKRVQRRQARVVALQTLFYYLERPEKDLRDCFEEIVQEIDPQDLGDDFAWQIVEGSVQNLSKIKVLIRAFAPEFTFEKIALINRVFLILGIQEMKFMETPPVVVINEYIELAKLYGESKSASLVNGVLDNYRKSLGLDRSK